MELMRGETEGALHLLSALGVRDWLMNRMHPERADQYVIPYFRSFADRRTAANTRTIYGHALADLRRYAGERLTFSELDERLIRNLYRSMIAQGYVHNTAVMRLRCIKAVCNAAIAEGLLFSNPFRAFPLRIEDTRHRSLSADSFRRFLSIPLTGAQAYARDYFLLSFLLLGINTADLIRLRPSDYTEGRLHYRRAKTGKLYDVAVLSEAAEIIERHRGKERLLDMSDRYCSTAAFTSAINSSLKKIGKEWNEITIYWARHSWATIAANDLDISQDVISHALGHSTGAKVTQTYVDFSLRKVDEANRRVTQWVLYKQRETGQ